MELVEWEDSNMRETDDLLNILLLEAEGETPEEEAPAEEEPVVPKAEEEPTPPPAEEEESPADDGLGDEEEEPPAEEKIEKVIAYMSYLDLKKKFRNIIKIIPKYRMFTKEEKDKIRNIEDSFSIYTGMYKNFEEEAKEKHLKDIKTEVVKFISSIS